MKIEYDGLEMVRIHVTSSDIFTSVTCISNVTNIKVTDVCISEHEGDSFCSEYDHIRIYEDFTPGETSQDDIC